MPWGKKPWAAKSQHASHVSGYFYFPRPVKCYKCHWEGFLVEYPMMEAYSNGHGSYFVLKPILYNAGEKPVPFGKGEIDLIVHQFEVWWKIDTGQVYSNGVTKFQYPAIIDPATPPPTAADLIAPELLPDGQNMPIPWNFTEAETKIIQQTAAFYGV